MQTDILSQKRAVRKDMRERLRSMDSGERETASAAACNFLLSLDCVKNAKTVLAYMAMKTELDPKNAVRALWQAGKRVAFPLCVENNGLALYVPKSEASFVRGSYGIMEPDPGDSELIGLDELDVIIAPGIAFSKKLVRLGQGGGYYDRLLSNCRAARVGFAFDMQIIDEVPAEVHDAVMDFLVSERGIFVN